MERSTLARAHGVFNVIGGVWPLVHLSSFEAVFGAKTDRWLVRTVAGLLLVNGCSQLAASRRVEGADHAAVVGIGTAATLATIDLIYAPRGRISKVYLLDAVLELGWIALWAGSRHSGHGR